ncbi:MAG: cytochrome c biogenesis protein CcsA [bacterium]|nr:cytochrome c biogenesis protein CcsA [bacterium]
MKILIVLILVLFFAVAQFWGLKVAPADRDMGDVYRILFVHVPAAWNALLFFFLNFIACLVTLIKKDRAWDRLAHAAAEVGLTLTGLALMLGSIWGRPTWGVWWTWDPRLTTTAILFILYSGYLILRKLIEDPEKRAKMTSGIGILLFLNVPIVYLSVRWWRTLHQVQSSPSTMDPNMVLALRLNAFAFLGIALFFLVSRIRLAQKQASLEESHSMPPAEGL